MEGRGEEVEREREEGGEREEERGGEEGEEEENPIPLFPSPHFPFLLILPFFF